MDTRLKQTPLPNPSLLFLTKNFNDGTYEPDDSSVTTATFSSLGLGNDVDIQSGVSSSRDAQANDRKQDKVRHCISYHPPKLCSVFGRIRIDHLLRKQTL